VEITVKFPGGKRVDAEVNGLVIQTDQPKQDGGDGSAPSPFVHFLASIATCAGIFVLSFCQERKIETAEITLTQKLDYSKTDAGKTKLNKVILEINVPNDFPAKYYNALIKVAEQCSLKKAIMDPPQFEIKTIVKQ
jgi:putative redox protein